MRYHFSSGLGRLSSVKFQWMINVETRLGSGRYPELILPAQIKGYTSNAMLGGWGHALGRQLSQLGAVRELEICLEGDRGGVMRRLPPGAKVSTLRLSKMMPENPIDKLTDVLITYPAFQHLVVLNCETIWNSAREADDLTRLLCHLPRTLRSLNLTGSYLS